MKYFSGSQHYAEWQRMKDVSEYQSLQTKKKDLQLDPCLLLIMCIFLVHIVLGVNQGWHQEFSNGRADSSDKGAKIWLSGYYKCQKSPKKLLFIF